MSNMKTEQTCPTSFQGFMWQSGGIRRQSVELGRDLARCAVIKMLEIVKCASVYSSA
jgi:hypothetical protein